MAFFKVGGFRLSFVPLLVHAGAKTCLGVEVGTKVCLGAGLGTQNCLGRVAQVAIATFIKVPLRVRMGLQRGTGVGLCCIAIDEHAMRDDLC